MARLILVRHGETEAGRDGRYSGQAATALTALGEAQHARLAARLASEPIDRVVSSDLARCRALGEAIAVAHGLGVEAEAALREAAFGAWEHLTYDEAMARDRGAMVAFNRDPAHVAPPGGESLQATGARARAVLDRLIKEHKGRGGALLVVSHGGTLRALLCGLLAIPLERYWTLNIDCASLTLLDVYPMGPIVSVLNDTCHLHGLQP